MNETLRTLISNLPESPGVYQYLDKDGKIIYVGKAKSLKKRVSSYFTKDHNDSGKTRILVRNIADIRFILTVTELDALLLENTLIKKHQPKYNINLKDDKTYPWIAVTAEPFPRVISTRRRTKDGSVYFGPYASVKTMYTLLDLIKQLYPIRNCRLNLSPANIQSNKYKVCLEYHLKNCKGPCEGLQSEQEHLDNIQAIKQILKGNTGEVLDHLYNKMQAFVEKLEFERAQELKEKLDLLKNYQSKSLVVNASIDKVDVFSFLREQDQAFVNYFRIVNGAIINSHTLELKPKIDESDEDLLMAAVIEMRERFESNSKEIILPFLPEIEFEGIQFLVPIRGDKKHLLDLSFRNLQYYRQEKIRQESLVDPDRHTNRILEQMKKDLRLQVLPRHMECFDNSNIQGTYAVAAMTVFKDAKPSKKDYRHFNIKTVEGPDDFASMEEIIYRRYSRVLEEREPLPDLIIIDGGKGQLGAALNSLEKLGLRGKIPIIGIAKRLEEIYYPGDSLPLYIDKRSETLKIIQYIRDEAHRFGITHHRKKRDKGTLKTELTEIKGISTATADKLLQEFKSVKKIRDLSRESLSAIVGESKARLVFAYFHPEAAPDSE